MDVFIEGVRVASAARDVVSISSLRIRSGRVTALLGPNGAGKTTLLRVIAGLEQPYAGLVRLSGASGDRRRVAYMFQEDVFLRRTLLENLELALRIGGMRRPDARSRAMHALRLLGLERLADRRADRMSGGEARRASLARALCLDASLLLLDEPMAGLDGPTYARLLDELPALLRTNGATSLLVTHLPQEAFRLADDLVLMSEGAVLAAGPKQEIGRAPRTAEVASVLGYRVLEGHAGLVAIPDGRMRLGRGGIEFRGTVNAVVDIVSEWDVLVSVGEVVVHVPLDRTAAPPAPGSEVYVHTLVAYPLSGPLHR